MINHCPPEMMFRVLEYYQERFGIGPELFGSSVFYIGPRGRVYLGPATMMDLPAADTCGILIARVQKTVKPSTFFFQSFGRFVTRNIVRLDEDQTRRYCGGDDIELDELLVRDVGRGFVMVTYGDIPLGCGLYKEGRLENQIPKPHQLNIKHW